MKRVTIIPRICPALQGSHMLNLSLIQLAYLQCGVDFFRRARFLDKLNPHDIIIAMVLF